jgi:hypothetical protein
LLIEKSRLIRVLEPGFNTLVELEFSEKFGEN